MNAKIFDCSKCFSFSFESRLSGTPLGIVGVTESVLLTSSTLLPQLDLSAIQPVELTGIEVNMGMVSADYLNQCVAIERLGLTMTINGERPTDTITSNIGFQNNVVYFNDFGTSVITFTKSEKWRNVSSINIESIGGYSPFTTINALASPSIEAVVGVTINLYYI